jgi:hypothetical protein
LVSPRRASDDQNPIWPLLSKAITLVSVTTDTNAPIKTATDAGSTQGIVLPRDDEDVQRWRQ